MGAKGGKPAKDAPISDNFNKDKQGVLSEKELKRLADSRANAAKARAALAAKHVRLKAEREDPNYRPPVLSDAEIDDGKSPAQMLEDMRYVYRSVNGREKLKKLMKEDKQFVFMVKELMKIEAALLSAKIRAKEDPGAPANQMVFVVLKGLADEVKLQEQMGDVDMKQITGALNPDGGTYEGG